MSVAAANKRASAICTADLQLLTRLEARMQVGKDTAGEIVRIARTAATATNRIDGQLRRMGASSSYQKKLAALVAANSKTVGAERELAAAYAQQPAGQHVTLNSSKFNHYYGKVNRLEGNASLLAANDGLPGVCVVGF